MKVDKAEEESNSKNKLVYNALYMWCHAKGKSYVASQLKLASTQSLERWLSHQKIPIFRHDFILEATSQEIGQAKKMGRKIYETRSSDEHSKVFKRTRASRNTRKIRAFA